jgi:hypothetical protein
MELTEHLVTQLRLARERLDEARGILDGIADVPIRATGPCVYRELMSAGLEHDDAWSWAGRILSEGEDLRQRLARTREQAEAIVDVIGVATGL